MVHAELPEPSLRGDRAGSSRLAWAVGISLALHLLCFGGYRAGKALHVWEKWAWPSWMRPPQMLTELFRKQPTPQQLALIEKRRENVPVPLLFVDVSPDQEEPEPPKKADYYSDKNSQAANPDTRRNTAVPKIDGKQTDVIKTQDIMKSRATPAQPPPTPAAPDKPIDTFQPEVKPEEPKSEAKPPAKPAEAKPEVKSAPTPAKPLPKPDPTPRPVPVPPKPAPNPPATLTPGDLTRGHPTEPGPPVDPHADKQTDSTQASESSQPAPAAPPAKPSKPRTIAEARARQPDQAGLAGEKMHQEGGVRRNRLQSSLDVQATPFGKYDAAVVSAIQNRWYDLLEGRWYADDRKGKVVLRFHLNSDGSISQMTLVQNTVDLTLALLCESAIRDPSPYRAWPDEMRRIVGADFREVTFTVYYR